jgi:transposase-like protein
MGQENRKDEVVEEYLRGGVSLRELERKYGINFRMIHRWVKEGEALIGPAEAAKGRARRGLVLKEPEVVSKGAVRGVEAVSVSEVRRLRKELEEARLYNKLLNAMIDIAEEQFEIPIRKKPGARQR